MTKYFKFFKTNGIRVSELLESVPSVSEHPMFFWVPVEVDEEGNHNVPAPYSIEDKIKFTKTVAFTQEELDQGGLVVPAEDGTYGHTLTVADNLMKVKVERLTLLGNEFTNYVWSKFKVTTQISFAVLLCEAVDKSFNLRKSNLYQVALWVQSALDQYYVKYDAIFACTTVEQVSAVTWDFGLTLDASVPNQDLRGNYRLEE